MRDQDHFDDDTKAFEARPVVFALGRSRACFVKVFGDRGGDRTRDPRIKS